MKPLRSQDNAKYAGDLVEALESGLADLEKRPEYFRQFDASNGWGTYTHFVPFVRECLEACKEHPKALVNSCI